MKKRIILSFLCCLTFFVAAQSKSNISGIVTDSEGNPLKNVQLSILYTSLSAKSNKKGVFTLKEILATDSLILTYDKKTSAPFAIRGSYLNIRLEKDFFEVTFDDNTNTSGILLPLPPEETRRGGLITSQMIERNAFRSLEQTIREMIPGVTFTSTDGSSLRLILRGGSNSLKTPSSALVVVDGAEYTFEDANNQINMTDVETIEVHKDGMGYGIKGSGGVLIIKMKRY